MNVLQEWAGKWWTWVSAASLQMAFLAVVVWCLDRTLLRRAWPQLRVLLWGGVLIRAFVPGHLPMVEAVQLADPRTMLPWNVAEIGSDRSVVWLFMVWFLGATGLMALLLWRRRRLRQSLLSDCVAEPAWLRDMARQIACEIGLKRAPALRVCLSYRTPALLGCRRPVVLVPHDLLHRRRQQVRHVLVHEMMHLRRRDHWTSWGCLLVQVAFWFHPLVWLAARRFRWWLELCCDNSAVRALGDATAYRRTLLQLSSSLFDLRTGLQLSFLHTKSQLLTRLEWLDRPARDGNRHRIAAVGLPFAPLLVSIPSQPAGKQSPPAASAVAPTVNEPSPGHGCLQRRYLVWQAMARQDAQR